MAGFIVLSCIIGAIAYVTLPDIPVLAAPVMGAMIMGISLGMRKLLGMDEDKQK